MPKSTVLICDDDMAVRYSLEDYLISEGFEPICVGNAESALDTIRHQRIDVIVLDVMLPGISGLDACKKIRSFCDIPIIMLSAKGNVGDRITGLETGADDYVAKPFSPREVVVRINRILQRAENSKKATIFSFADLTVFPERNQVQAGNTVVDMTAKEMRLLVLLVNHAGKICTREQLLNAVWGYDYLGDTRVVDTMVKRIRKKIVLSGVHFAISSVYGVGYKIEETAGNEH